ncbi:MAG: hypothetical protein KatS3mg031_1405 [Chitinophagales bacterium]|nr:MAG: hypothetical protein KatS3mg031_1405 [Chitinophagales bacterium]
MGCYGCQDSNGLPRGCRNNGYCRTGSCNKLNTFDWLADLPVLPAFEEYNYHEVSFKNGSRKGFFKNEKGLPIETGDFVVVETAMGTDVGEVTLSGELVMLQMKKKHVRDRSELKNIIAKASEKDMDNLKAARSREHDIMMRARAIARNMKLDMKVSDVEIQADHKKVTFYYTAGERVDFRELIKVYAREFKMKIEMRQIGARQEAGRLGGIGDCGRELCCSTWLTEFKSVSTAAARYQNLSLNLEKLSGQCGRLKCCLNYELDTYLEALDEFPKNADRLETIKGTAFLQKTDILKRLMMYAYREDSKIYTLTLDQVKEILAMNARGEKPEDLVTDTSGKEDLSGAQDELVGHISLESLEQTTGKRRKKKQARKQQRPANHGERNSLTGNNQGGHRRKGKNKRNNLGS